MIRELEACLESYTGVREVIFLGDLFDAYLEYPRSIQAVADMVAPLFRTLIERGVDVHYHIGNHDLWHLDHFSIRVGVHLHQKPVVRVLFDRRYYFSHGDEEDLGRGLARLAQQIMRHPLSYRLYRMILPANLGQALPEWVSRCFATSESKLATMQSLLVASEAVLKSDDIDVVVLGHSHSVTRIETTDGTYLNTGSWWLKRSFLEISPSGDRLRIWETGRTLRS